MCLWWSLCTSGGVYVPCASGGVCVLLVEFMYLVSLVEFMYHVPLVEFMYLVPLVEFMYLVFTRMPGEVYHCCRRLRSLLSYLCYVFRPLINSLVC